MLGPHHYLACPLSNYEQGETELSPIKSLAEVGQCGGLDVPRSAGHPVESHQVISCTDIDNKAQNNHLREYNNKN